MFLKERERDYVQREKKKKKSVFVKKHSTARVPFDIPERERETRPMCGNPFAVVFQTETERNHF